MNQDIQKLDDFEKAELESIHAFKEGGGLVAATFCRFFPASLLSGFGIRPLRIMTGTDTAAESAGERLVRPDTCPFCKSMLGNFMEKRSLHGLSDLVVGLITCDPMRRSLERISLDLEIPLFPVHLPATATEASEDYFVQSVNKAMENLESHTRLAFDPEAARKAEKARADTASLIRETLLEGRVSPLVMHRINRLFAWARPQALLDFMKALLPGLPPFEAHRKVLVTGSVSCEEDDTLYEIFTNHGVGVLPMNCTGLHALEGFADLAAVEDREVADQLARAVFRSPACIRKRPTRGLYDRIDLVLRETGAAGIVLKTLSFCDLWFTEKERMKQSFDLPVLVLDMGYGEGARDRAAVRLEAFLETLA